MALVHGQNIIIVVEPPNKAHQSFFPVEGWGGGEVGSFGGELGCLGGGGGGEASPAPPSLDETLMTSLQAVGQVEHTLTIHAA